MMTISAIRSVWENSPAPMTGLLDAADWSSAATFPIPAGTMLVQNDAAGVDIGLDLTDDFGNDVGTDDYFWFVVDVDNNAAVTPSRDVLFGLFPGSPNRLGRWLMAGPNESFPVPSDQVIASSCRQGFGPSPLSPDAHRQWQLRLQFSEMGITIDPAAPPPVIRFGLRVASSTPSFVLELPDNVLSDFASFNEIILATRPAISYPVDTSGAVIGGVGLIPAGKIGDDGYAQSIPSPYPIDPDETAFGGLLEILGNHDTLTALLAAGATKYQVLHRYGNTSADLDAAPWTTLRRTWTNYRWNGTTSVMDTFAPDVDDMYPFADPDLDYSIPNLLIQWSTGSEPNNLHQLQVQFFAADGTVVPTDPQTLTLRIDNGLPTARLINILHDGAPVPPCLPVTMNSDTDGVQLEFEAYDAEGDLYAWSLTASYGHGQGGTIVSDGYGNHRAMDHVWQGVSDAVAPAAPGYVPPTTCAYLFQITATARVTNGYSYIGQATDFQTITLNAAGPSMMMRLRPVGSAHALGRAPTA